MEGQVAAIRAGLDLDVVRRVADAVNVPMPPQDSGGYAAIEAAAMKEKLR